MDIMDPGTNGLAAGSRCIRPIAVGMRGVAPLLAGKGGLALSPIVDHETSGPAVAGLIWPVHRDDVHSGPKASAHHQPIGFFAPGVHSGEDGRHAGVSRERGAAVEQGAEAGLGSEAGTRRAEFHEQAIPTSLAGWTPMADGEAGETARSAAQQQSVAEARGPPRCGSRRSDRGLGRGHRSGRGWPARPRRALRPRVRNSARAAGSAQDPGVTGAAMTGVRWRG